MLLVQRAERDIFCSIFSKSFPFDFVTFCPHKKQKFFIGGSRLDEKIDVPSKLCFPSRTILIRLPFLVFFATFTAWNDDGKIVFFAQFITQVADAVVGLCAVMVFRERIHKGTYPGTHRKETGTKGSYSEKRLLCTQAH